MHHISVLKKTAECLETSVSCEDRALAAMIYAAVAAHVIGEAGTLLRDIKPIIAKVHERVQQRRDAERN